MHKNCLTCDRLAYEVLNSGFTFTRYEMERINSPAWHEHYCSRHDISSGPCDCSNPQADRACLECYEEWNHQNDEDENNA